VLFLADRYQAFVPLPTHDCFHRAQHKAYNSFPEILQQLCGIQNHVLASLDLSVIYDILPVTKVIRLTAIMIWNTENFIVQIFIHQ